MYKFCHNSPTIILWSTWWIGLRKILFLYSVSHLLRCMCRYFRSICRHALQGLICETFPAFCVSLQNSRILYYTRHTISIIMKKTLLHTVTGTTPEVSAPFWNDQESIYNIGGKIWILHYMPIIWLSCIMNWFLLWAVRNPLPLPMQQPRRGRFWVNSRIPLKCI